MHRKDKMQKKMTMLGKRALKTVRMLLKGENKIIVFLHCCKCEARFCIALLPFIQSIVKEVLHSENYE